MKSDPTVVMLMWCTLSLPSGTRAHVQVANQLWDAAMLVMRKGAYDGHGGPRTELCFRVLGPTTVPPSDFSFLDFEE